MLLRSSLGRLSKLADVSVVADASFAIRFSQRIFTGCALQMLYSEGR